MTPADIQKYFNPVFEQANALKEAFERKAHNEQLAASSQVSKTKTSSCYFTTPLILCPSKLWCTITANSCINMYICVYHPKNPTAW